MIGDASEVSMPMTFSFHSGHFVSIILGDYLSTILGTVRDGLDFSLRPLDASVQFCRGVTESPKSVLISG